MVALSSFSCPVAVSSELNGDLRFAALGNGVAAFTPSGNRLSRRGVAGVKQLVGEYENTALFQKFSPAAKRVEDIAFILRHFWSDTLFNKDRQLPQL